jgi:hypothetical protein
MSAFIEVTATAQPAEGSCSVGPQQLSDHALALFFFVKPLDDEFLQEGLASLMTSVGERANAFKRRIIESNCHQMCPSIAPDTARQLRIREVEQMFATRYNSVYG